MDRNFLLDRVSGCLLGLGISDAMGQVANNLTPFEVISKYHFIDGFHSDKNRGIEAGQYGGDARAALLVAKSISESKGIPPPDACQLCSDIIFSSDPHPSGTASNFLSRFIPIGLFAAMKGLPDQEVGNACKLFGGTAKKADVLGGVVLALVVKECIRNFDDLAIGPKGLYDDEKSLLARMIALCVGVEAKLDPSDGSSLSGMLGYARRKLMAKDDVAKFHGIIGSRPLVNDSLTRALFQFLSCPDDFRTVCKAVSLGGSASLDGAIVGGLVGAFCGTGGYREDMRSQVKNSVSIEGLATKLVEDCAPKETAP
jgi:ADP-ribosylglycohydrolase